MTAIEISVVIPVRNERETIGPLLADLRAQTCRPVQIVVVDTGSTDGTRDFLAAEAARDPQLCFVALTDGYPGAGRNAGLRAARGEWIAFVDGGMRVAADWLALLARPVARGDVDLVLGGLEPVTDSRAARAAALAFVPARRPTPEGGSWRGFCLPSSLVRRELALAVGGFPEALRSGEDLRFFERLRPRARIAYAPDATVHWRHASTPQAVWRRFRTYAEHSFRAGLMRDWFDVAARRYVAFGALGGPVFPIVVMGSLLARALVMQRRKPELVDRDPIGQARQVLEVAGYLGIIDAATFTAWWRWRRDGRVRLDESQGSP